MSFRLLLHALDLTSEPRAVRPAEAAPDAATATGSRDSERAAVPDPKDNHIVDYVDALLDELGTPAARIVVGGTGESVTDEAQTPPSAMGGDIGAYDDEIQAAIRDIAPDDTFEDDRGAAPASSGRPAALRRTRGNRTS